MFAGFSLQCYKCFGNSDVCNNSTLELMDCLVGQDMCLTMKAERDGKETRLHGCATRDDCTSHKSCTSTVPGQINCQDECCATDKCNAAPYKGNIYCSELSRENFLTSTCLCCSPAEPTWLRFNTLRPF